ncbi:hypothetical protein AYO20_06170 [Fonsecaea nubica]|uniref:Uncharacterized protein n=1 Tax=Fonsecaea nubica TaxID=856822 RepID=A0A178CXB8_9EURO|nr:hypothetical protein AYO20_06170 [Fonsecaea nubica]OAL34540.1 hypothetical protein AYO20_06170 [Fonsecaea nubica]
MANNSRLSNATRDLLKNIPGPFNALISQTAEGKNPHAQFPFHEVKVIRGTVPHPPNTDRREVRNSITLQFNGTAGGPMVAHRFNDGTIRSSAQMHQDINQRRAQDERLTTEEKRFPQLQQTTRRRQVETQMMTRIQAARSNPSWSIVQKQLEKQSAEQEYNQVLQRQAQERPAPAQAAASGSKTKH